MNGPKQVIRSIAFSVPFTTPGNLTQHPGDRAAARPLRWQPTCVLHRSALTVRDRLERRHLYAASLALSLLMVVSASTAVCRGPAVIPSTTSEFLPRRLKIAPTFS